MTLIILIPLVVLDPVSFQIHFHFIQLTTLLTTIRPSTSLSAMTRQRYLDSRIVPSFRYSNPLLKCEGPREHPGNYQCQSFDWLFRRQRRGWSTDRAGQLMCLRHVSGAKTLALVQPSFERRIAELGTGSYPGCLFERRELLGLHPPPSLFEGSTATSFVNPISTCRPPPCPLSSWTSSSATLSSSSLSFLLQPVSLTHWHAVVHPSSLFLHPSSLVLGTVFSADAIEYSPSQGDRAYLSHATGGDLNPSSSPSQAGPIRSALQPVLFVGRRTLLEATVGSLSDLKIVGCLFVPARLSGLLLLVVVVVARRRFTARVARRCPSLGSHRHGSLL